MVCSRAGLSAWRRVVRDGPIRCVKTGLGVICGDVRFLPIQGGVTPIKRGNGALEVKAAELSAVTCHVAHRAGDV